jgi:hypothetical protein
LPSRVCWTRKYLLLLKNVSLKVPSPLSIFKTTSILLYLYKLDVLQPILIPIVP